MSDDEIIRYVEGLAASVPTSEAPVGALVAAGERSRRRRGTALVTLAAAAAVVLVVGLTAALAGGTDHTTLPADDPSTAGSSASESGDPQAAPALDGTWVVEALVSSRGNNLFHDPAGTGSVQLTFDDGTLSGTTGCNSIFGTYLRNGSELTFPHEDLGSSLVACKDEPPLVERLLDVRLVSQGEGAKVQLNAGNGMIVAVLVPLKDAGAVIPTEDANTTARDLCQTPVIAFVVNQEPETERAASPEAAVEPWLTAGQEFQSVGPDGNGNRYVKVGAAVGEPAAVHLVEPTDSGWVIRRTTVCLVESPEEDGCGAVIDAPDGIRWTIEPADPPGLGIGVGGIWQQGRIPACARFDADGMTDLGPRAPVAPVTLFTAQEMPRNEELTVSIVPGDVRKLHP